jgi:prepilin peptidase CpaA
MPFVPAIIVALVAISVVAGIWDWRVRRIPNWLTFSGVILGLVLNAIVAERVLDGLAFAGMGLLVSFGIYLVLYVLHAKSAGDVKLMAAIGALVGWREWLLIFFVASIIGAVAGLVVAWQAGRLKRTFSNVGFILSEITRGRPPHVRREDVDVKSEKSLRIPGGTMAGLGVLVVLGWAWWTKS